MSRDRALSRHAPTHTARRVIGRLLADVTPLRVSPAFRRFWIGSICSGIGSQMTTFAVALQVYLLTHSSAAVGAVGLAIAVPGIVVALVSGSLIDAVDRRVLVLCATTLQMVLSAALAVQAFAELDRVWLLYLLVAFQSMVGAVNSPARRTFMPRLLPPDKMAAGAALTMLVMNTSAVVGPALAGVIAAAGGLKVCYLVDALSFTAALYGVGRLPAMRPEGAGTRAGLRSVTDGLGFIKRSRVLSGALLADLNAMVLAMPVALFPAINAERFGGSPRTLGLMTASLAIGGLTGSTLSGPVSRVARQGRAMLVAGAIWGVAVAGFGLADGIVLTLGALVLAGFVDSSSVVLRTTIIQIATPDAYRGRISAAEYVVGSACPQLGNFRAGAIGSLTTSNVSAFTGGAAAALGAGIIALTFPALWRYRAIETAIVSL